METKVYTKKRLLERKILRNVMEMEQKYIFGVIAEMEVNNMFKVNSNNLRSIEVVP